MITLSFGLVIAVGVCAVHWLYKRSRHPQILRHVQNSLKLAGQGTSAHHQRYQAMAKAMVDVQEALEFRPPMTLDQWRTTRDALLEITRDDVLAAVGMRGPSDRYACNEAVMRLCTRFTKAYPRERLKS